MTRIEYSSSPYYNFVVDDLPEEGILTGIYGSISYKKVYDGIAVYESTLSGSGFVPIPVSADVYVPATINNIPVVELHQALKIDSKLPVAIEGANLKRTCFSVDRKNWEDQISSQDDNDRLLALLMMQIIKEREGINLNEKFIDLEILFSRQFVDSCSISCEQQCVLGSVYTS